MKTKNLPSGGVTSSCLAAAILMPVTLFYLSTTALSAVPPMGYNPSGSELKQSQDLFEYYHLGEKVEPQPPAGQGTVTDKTPQQTETPATDEVKVFISRIVVDVSEILTTEEIAIITNPYENRQVSIRELQAVAGKLNALYADKKYITAKAILPPQTIENGIVRIQLVEGRIGHLLLSGNRYTRDSFFLERLELVNGDLVRLDKLEKQLNKFNLTNDVRLRAELKAGTAFGTTDIVLIAKEPQNEQFLFFSDNAGSKNTGQYRFGFSWSNQSLTGNRDALTLMPVWTKGSFAGSMAYSITAGDGRLAVSYDKNRIDILSGEYAHLNVEGYSSDLGLSYTWPRSVLPDFKSEQSLQIHRKNSETLFDGSKLLDSAVNTAVMSFSLQASGKNRAAYVYHAITRGHTDTGTGSDFVKYNLTAVSQRALQNGAAVTLRLNAQLTADRNLPTVEQLSLGGMSSVRGFPTGLKLGDRGYFVSAEWSRPLSETVTGIVFLDHGGALPFKGNGQSNTSDDYLTSTGFGLTMKFDDRNSAKVVLGIPLQHAADYSPRVHFIWQSLL